jgi:iron complex transport system permease protein
VTNVQLLVLALISLTAAVWLSVKRTSAAAAPAVLAAFMLLLALGGPVWEWSKHSEGAGLPSNVQAVAFSESLAAPAFLWASIGAGLSALLVPRIPAQALPTRKVAPSRKLGIAVAIVSAVTFVTMVMGEGPSFFKNDAYLYSDGTLFLLMASLPGIVSGVLGIVLTVWEKDRRLRILLIATSALWFIGPLSTGSRMACAVPIMGCVLIIFNEIRRRRLHLPLIAAAVALFVTAVFTFSVVSNARAMPHGLLNVPQVMQVTASDMANSTDSISVPAKQLMASVFVGFPLTEESVHEYVDTGTLLGNANPLPGSAQSADLERYWPYAWAPLSFAGEWFGAMGCVGQILIFGAMGWIFGLAMHNLQRSRFRLMSFLPLGFVALVGVYSIEYSSRAVWRMISLSVILLIASYLVRERTNKGRRRDMFRETRDEQPPNAIGNLEKSAFRVSSTVAVPNRVAMTVGQRYG